MKPRQSDDEPSMDPHNGALTSWVRSGDDAVAAHDRCEVDLTVAERCCFDEIVAPMWTLRVTRGRRSAVFERGGTCLFFGIAGMVVSVIGLGTLPVLVSFAAFMLAVVAFAELSEHAAGSNQWGWARRSSGLVVTALELLVVAAIVAAAFVVRFAKRRT